MIFSYEGKMKIKALVAVRTGLQRVINKNIRPFAGSSLLEVELNQLKRISNLNGIVVNSNDAAMLDIAALNFAINIISRDKMIDCKNVVGYKSNIYLIDGVEAFLCCTVALRFYDTMPVRGYAR